MNVVLISPYGSLVNVGLRVLAAYLKQLGYKTRLIFLPGANEIASFLLFDPDELYDPPFWSRSLSYVRTLT